MSDLTKRLSKLAKALTQPGDSYQKIFQTVKDAYYSATAEGKKKMQDKWNELGL